MLSIFGWKVKGSIANEYSDKKLVVIDNILEIISISDIVITMFSSIIVDALKLLFGARADLSLLRSGTDHLRVEGIYSLNQVQDDELVDALRDNGIETPDDDLVIGRDITRAGRNTCRVNGRIVPLSFLNMISSYLVDISGQGQQFSLLRPTEHIKILDKVFFFFIKVKFSIYIKKII